MSRAPVAAIDLGASSGRVMVGWVGSNELELFEVHRFPNRPADLPDGRHWDILELYGEILAGLRKAGESTELASIGIDSWGVDYGLIDDAGALLGNPHHYRDPRTNAVVPAVHAIVPPERLYERTGIQFLPFNTIYQLVASRDAGQLDRAQTMLMIPDLLCYWLTGQRTAEETNASTTGLLDARTRTWASDLVERLGLPASVLLPPAQPGDVAGGLREAVAAETGLSSAVPVTLVGSHDTASAVVGVPADGDDFAYVASGTWSLVGVELEAPILTEASRAANLTNEAGVDGRVRYHRNVMGLWLLQESIRSWERLGPPADTAELLAAAEQVPDGGPIIDPNDPAFLPPGDMPARIADVCERVGKAAPATRAATVRCILDSLADAYARTVRSVSALSGKGVSVVHVVGGGSQNRLLCQLTADACGLPVVAGPTEATALGNVLVQARAHGMTSGDLDALRRLVRATQPLRRYEPRPAGAPLPA